MHDTMTKECHYKNGYHHIYVYLYALRSADYIVQMTHCILQQKKVRLSVNACIFQVCER